MVELVREKLQKSSVDQYKIEERSIVAKRIKSSGNRIKRLVSIAKTDDISLMENIEALRMEIYDLTKDVNFKKCDTMGEVLSLGLDFVKRNCEGVNMNQILGQS